MFDTKCYELAEYFLTDHQSIDTEESRSSLAQDIQDAVEMWFTTPLDEQGKTK